MLFEKRNNQFYLVYLPLCSDSLTLPPGRNVKVSKKERYEPKQVSHVFSSLLKARDDPEKVNKQHELLELAQAHCVQVTHADCEELLGEVSYQ